MSALNYHKANVKVVSFVHDLLLANFVTLIEYPLYLRIVFVFVLACFQSEAEKEKQLILAELEVTKDSLQKR